MATPSSAPKGRRPSISDGRMSLSKPAKPRMSVQLQSMLSQERPESRRLFTRVPWEMRNAAQASLLCVRLRVCLCACLCTCTCTCVCVCAIRVWLYEINLSWTHKQWRYRVQPLWCRKRLTMWFRVSLNFWSQNFKMIVEENNDFMP